MYCILYYIEYEQFINYQNDPSASSAGSLETPDVDPNNQILFFNPNCILQLIIDFISATAHLNMNGDFDLCSSSGDLMNIISFPPTVSGLAIFRPRETYFIVRVRRNDMKSKIEEIAPMINPTTELYQQLMKTIKEKYFRKKSSLLKGRAASSKHSLATSQSSNNSGGSKYRRRFSSHI